MGSKAPKLIDLPLPAIVAVLTEMTIFIICGAALALHEWLTSSFDRKNDYGEKGQRKYV